MDSTCVAIHRIKNLTIYGSDFLFHINSHQLQYKFVSISLSFFKISRRHKYRQNRHHKITLKDDIKLIFDLHDILLVDRMIDDHDVWIDRPIKQFSSINLGDDRGI